MQAGLSTIDFRGILLTGLFAGLVSDAALSTGRGPG